jgi:hypothetical protein
MQVKKQRDQNRMEVKTHIPAALLRHPFNRRLAVPHILVVLDIVVTQKSIPSALPGF